MNNKYIALVSFTTQTTQYQQGQVIELTDQTLIQDLLQANYIKTFDGVLEITQNGVYDVQEYDDVSVDVEGSSEEVIALVDEINGEVI